MDYISQIRTLAGHGNFQIFEHFIRVVAEIIFKGSVLEEPRDRDALNDFLVLKPDGRHAVIEAKATDNRQRVDTLKALKDLIKTWNPQKQRERLAAHRLKHPTIDQAIIATTVTVEGQLWEEHNSALNLAGFELWDA